MKQIDTFTDERHCNSWVEGWLKSGPQKQTNAVLANRSMFNTLGEFLAAIERTYGDPDHDRMAPTQLHALNMMAGMTTDEYTANFEMLAGRSFNEEVLEDAYI